MDGSAALDPPAGSASAGSAPAGRTAPESAREAVFVSSDAMPDSAQAVTELNFDALLARGGPITAEDLLDGMRHMGFQASSVAEAVRIINDMRKWRDPETGGRTSIFLGYTSNLISSGLRGVLRFLVQHQHVACVVTTAGGIEEDLIKCMGSTYLSSFSADGASLRQRGLNRIGNLVIPNENYCRFETWVMPILDRLLDEQEASRATDPTFAWTPSAVIHRLGREIADERSVCYWAWRNNVPVFCPALTDGSLGDMLYMHTFRAWPRRLHLDIVDDIARINGLAVHAARTGIIVLGGGLVKHHINNACMMRNGAESAVYINTAQEFDGSDAGARPDEAVSWGKIKIGADHVKVYCEATICFPLIVANTFAKDMID